MVQSIEQRIAEELGVQQWQVAAAVGLLDDGATVPFVARYRKEVTGTLDDIQLRELQERLAYLRELEKRREAILESIRSQGKLTPELEAQVLAAALIQVRTGLFCQAFAPDGDRAAPVDPESLIEDLLALMLRLLYGEVR